MSQTDAPRVNDRREIFGWKMYDWANSAFSTTVAGALLNPYLTDLAQTAVGENGVVLDLGPLGALHAKSFFEFFIGLSVGLQALLLPILGGIADYSPHRKRLMAAFCYIGASATCLLFFIDGNLYMWGGLLFIVANLSFGSAIVMYNSFLPDICTSDQGDKVSSGGYAFGYLGGGLLLAMNLVLILGRESLGLTSHLAVRISLLSAGVWWAVFALVPFARLRASVPAQRLPAGQSYFTIGFSQLGVTFRKLARLPNTLRYLVAYLFFNDGVQTVLAVSSKFLQQVLFTKEERDRGDYVPFVLEVFLLTQFVAFFGAHLFERIARVVGTKRAIIVSLVIWSGVVIYAFGFLRTQPQAWGMAVVIAIVLGGSQALSRSLFARMIPNGYEASFFGIYEVSERGTSWMGPVLFGLVASSESPESFRYAILSLIFLFITGTIILAFTNTDKAIHDAGNALPEEAKLTAAAAN